MRIKKYIGLVLLISLCMSFFSLPAKAAEPATYDVFGKPFFMPQHTGKWIFINYWAAWCSACIQEIPELNKFAQISGNANAIFFAVNFDQIPDDTQQQFARRYGVSYTMLHENPLRSLIPEESISSLPMTYAISPTGEVKQLYGTQTMEDLLHIMS